MFPSWRQSFVSCQPETGFCLFRKSTIGQFIPLTNSPYKVSASALLSRANSLIGFSPASRVIPIAFLKTCWSFSRRLFMVILIQHHTQWGSWSHHWAVCCASTERESPAKCHRMTEAATCTIGNPVVVACLLHLTAAGTTASPKRCWSKASVAFGIKLHWKRQDNGTTAMEPQSSAFQVWPCCSLLRVQTVLWCHIYQRSHAICLLMWATTVWSQGVLNTYRNILFKYTLMSVCTIIKNLSKHVEKSNFIKH